MSISAYLGNGAAGYRFDLSGEQLRRLDAHWELLLKWNRKINLTRITDPAEAALRHYGESLFLAQQVTPGRVVDVGSGAGFPGFPVGVFRPECQVDLVESTRKKAVFLAEACRGVENVRVLGLRADEVEGSYDWIIARALNPIEVLRLPLAPRAALLVSGTDAAKLNASELIPLPWDRRRVLAIVSRARTAVR